MTDIAGSTQAWDTAAIQMSRAVARHYDIIDSVVSQHGGVRPVEQGEGDSTVSAFALVGEAVACAASLQRSLHEDPLLTDLGLRIRIALHTGEAQLRDDGNYFGPALIRCARIRDLAHGGQTLLSGVTADLASDRLPDQLEFSDIGYHRLRGLRRPERVYQLKDSGLPATFPAIRSETTGLNNLPIHRTSFVGRQEQIERLKELLPSARCITLTGPGGAGKTRTALQVAGNLLEAFPDGVWFIELARIADGSLIPAAIAEPLGIMESPIRSFEEALVSSLQAKKTLLVIDNCEHLVEPISLIVDEILRECPGVSVLATSREALAVEGEIAWPLPTLPLPGDAADLAGVASSDAGKLFLERAQLVRPDHGFTDTDAPAIAEICHRLDGMPLAIELAAARTKILSPQDIANGLKDRFALLGGGVRGGTSPHQTLKASVSWSNDLLTDEEAQLFRRLSVFRGDFSLEAVAAVCSDADEDRYALLDHMAGLVDKSLLKLKSGDGSSRYLMLETIREFAREKLVGRGEAESQDVAHLNYFAAIADTAVPGLEGGSTSEWLDRIEVDYDNFRMALDRATAKGHLDAALRITTALAHYWLLRGQFTEGVEKTRALFQQQGGDPGLRARALVSACALWFYLFDLGSGMSGAQEALSIAATIGDDITRGRALNWLGWGANMLDPASARTHFEESTAIARREQDPWGLSYALNGLGFVSSVRGTFDQGHSLLEEARSLVGLTGDELVYRQSLIWDGWMYVESGQYDLADQALRLSISMSEKMRDPLSLNIGEMWLGVLETYRGNHDAAEQRLLAGAEGAREMGNPMMEANFVGWLGYLHLARGDYERALQEIDGAVNFFQGIGANWFTATYMAIRARSREATGAFQEAREDHEQALGLAELAQQAWSQGRALAGLARLELEQGNSGAAQSKALDAIERLRPSGRGYVPGQVEVLEILAAAAAQESRLEQSARLLGAADAARSEIGYIPFAPDAAARDRLVSTLETALGSRLQKELLAGGEMSVDDAVAYAARN